MGASLGNIYSDLCHNHSSVGLSFGLGYEDDFSFDIELISPDMGKDIEVSKIRINSLPKSYTSENSITVVDETIALNPQKSCRGFITPIKSVLPELEVDKYRISVDYIGPFRKIPERFFTSDANRANGRIGYFGENAYDCLTFNPVLERSVSDWFMDAFGRGVKMKEVCKGLHSLMLASPDEENTAAEVNIVDEGQGMHQVLPIVVKALQKSDVNDIIVVEQPELHLHPAAHASLGELFASSAIDNNHSFVIETHSENLLLGLRKAVVDKSIKFTADDVVIYFVDYDEGEESAYLSPITIDEKGNLSDWPDGVFNESFELLMDLKKLAAK